MKGDDLFMDVAIMGAGLSGLSCAIVLEKNGISPVVFESRSQVGDRFVNGEVILSIVDRPIHDSILYFADKYGLFLKPVSEIKELVFYSENESAVIKGNLGYTNIRGRDEDSYEHQLSRQIKSKIIFNSQYTYEKLREDFSHVVLATGDADYAKKAGNYREDLTATLRGAIVEGTFDLYSLKAWLDNRFAPKGNCYLIPISEKEANIVIAYPDYPENREKDIDTMWSMFYDRVCKDLKQDLKITDKFEVTRYIMGICEHSRVHNTYFAGNNFGSIMPFMGLGQVASILTGIYAAQAICGQDTYENLTGQLRKAYENSLVMRKAIEKLDNSKLDMLVGSLKGKLGDKLFNGKIKDPLKYISYILRLFV